MRGSGSRNVPLSKPLFRAQASKLANMLRNTSTETIQTLMHISAPKAKTVKSLYDTWSTEENLQIPAIDSFTGDIYSGLQVHSWSDADRLYAQEHLVILSGLYGGLRPCDGIMPYRLEMGYRLPDGRSMYEFWSDSIASLLPRKDPILNLSAVEYTKAFLPYVKSKVITPKFLTISPKTGQPTFVAVHAKIARGAFARWVVQRRIQDTAELIKFKDLGYRYNKVLSTDEQPVFVCKEFGGLGLSIRLLSS
jgi:uncharacterized protein